MYTFKKLATSFVIILMILPLAPAGAQEKLNQNSKVQIKVVGGATVPISYAPWQVALLDLSRPGRSDWDKQFCGGSIIRQDWILTAAHCLEGNLLLRNLRVLAGQSNLNTRRLSNNTLSVKKIIIHENYNSLTLQNDIALVQLSNTLTFSPGTIEAIQISSAKPPAETIGRISGWGYAWPTDGNSPGIPVPGQSAYPSDLLGGEVSISSDSYCLESLGSDYFSNSMLCAQGGLNNAGIIIDTCYGDSGGPLATFSSDAWFLAGITSWGVGCGWTTPGVYTNVANYKSWIEAKINSKISQSIIFAPPSRLSITLSPVLLVATSSSGLVPTISANSLSVCSLTGFILTLLSAGTCNLTAIQIGNEVFSAANPVSVNIEITNPQTPQIINFSPPSSLKLNQSPFNLTVSTSSGLLPVLTSSTLRVCTISGYVLTLRAIGTCTLTASQTGNATWESATPITRNIQIIRK
jgi:secreted trypsin-like serine protease